MKRLRTYCQDSSKVDKWPTCSTARPIREPAPEKRHNNEYSSRSKGYCDGVITSVRLYGLGSSKLTVIDLGHRKSNAGERSRMFVKALQPVAHSGLWLAVVPDNIQHGCG
jgi:hypothetical protein